jgi:hypothetical protein
VANSIDDLTNAAEQIRALKYQILAVDGEAVKINDALNAMGDDETDPQYQPLNDVYNELWEQVAALCRQIEAIYDDIGLPADKFWGELIDELQVLPDAVTNH